MHKFILGVLLGLAFVTAIGVIAAGKAQPITYHTYTEGTNGKYKVIEVKTGLTDYVFSENNGTMKSVYLYFAPYGSRVAELVPGTITNTKTLVRQYMTYLGSIEWNKFSAVFQAINETPTSVPISLLKTLGYKGITLSKAAQISMFQNDEWKITDQKITYLIYRVDKELKIYRVSIAFPFTVTTDPKAIAPVHYTLASPRVPGQHKLAVEFTGTVAGMKITKQFVLYNDPYYNLNFTLTVDNPSTTPVPLFLIIGSYVPTHKGPQLVYEFNGSTSLAPLAPGSYTSFDGIGLLGKTTVFFLKTTGVSGVTPFIAFPDNGPEVFGVKLTAPAGKSTYSFPMYAGRRRYLLMDAVGLGTLDNPGTGARTIIPVVQFLEWLYKYTGNYGWAIILFTIITRLVLFPLMRKQYHSMAKMQKLQPKLALIQKRFKDDRQLLQQKMMELYKKEGVNPMGGCLPMFIQLPILILLWKAILYASEEIHFSPGFMWIPDLSLRDPYFILVIVTTGIMMLQQRLMMPMSSGQTTGSQKYMGYLFPVIMAFFFWNFPAGLWLYYLLTTLSQVGQQAFVNWELARAEASEPPAMAPDLSGESEGDEPRHGDDNRSD